MSDRDKIIEVIEDAIYDATDGDGIVSPSKAARAALTALEASGMAVVGWRPIESAPKGRTVIVAYRNRLGNWRQVMARYYGPEALDSDETEDGFAPEGWYEESDTQENLLRTDEPPEFWQPLLPSPTDGAPSDTPKVRTP